MSTPTSRSAVAESNSPSQTIRVYSTLSKRKEPLETVQPGRVGIYLCGPTVYDKAHIGHMVGPVIFDTIKRYLVYSGYEVNWVVNITDVDDKLIQKATERGISMAQVAEENTADYFANLAAMGVDQIDHFPKATESMPAIIAFIEGLVEKGCAYRSNGDVYFEVGKDPRYGKLSNRSLESLQGEGGEMASRKRAPGDFALWKSAKPGEPSWDSPWGQGRPGWHIECSAMSREILGETFDMHGGGLDLVFPHHENEIAQSECLHGKPMAKYWLHNGLMRAATDTGKVGGRSDRTAEDAAGKISRSKGAGGLAELLERQGGERIRFFLLRTHYRSTIVFGEEGIAEAAQGLETFYRLFKRYRRITGESFYEIEAAKTRAAGEFDAGDDATLGRIAELRRAFLAAMDDDFNTGAAVGEMFELARVLNKYCDDVALETTGKNDPAKPAVFRRGLSTLRELGGILGLFVKPPQEKTSGSDELVGKLMELVIALRADARAKKDFATADRVRDALAAAGIALEDRAGATEWSAQTSGDELLASVMQLLIELRAAARAKKDFAAADRVRDSLAELGVTLEDRAGGTEWTVK